MHSANKLILIYLKYDACNTILEIWFLMYDTWNLDIIFQLVLRKFALYLWNPTGH